MTEGTVEIMTKKAHKKMSKEKKAQNKTKPSKTKASKPKLRTKDYELRTPNSELKTTNSELRTKHSDLRTRAEDKLRSKLFSLDNVSDTDLRNVFHELQVHQIELEMQNEELRAAQEQLEESRSKYADLYDFAPVGYFTLDTHGLIIGSNLTGARQLGMDRSFLTKKPFPRFIHKDDQDTFYLHRQEVFETETSRTCEIRLKRKDKTGFYAQLVSMALVDSDDHSMLMLTAVMNITERKQTDELLRASRDRYRSFIELTGQLGWTTNADGEIEEDIPTWRQYTGQSEEEIKGWGWAKALHPDDVEHTAQVWKNAVAKKSDYEVEYRVRRHDGAYRLFLARGVPVFKDDRSIREWVGTCIDITERKMVEAEQLRLRQRLEAQWAIVQMVDADHQVICDRVLSELVALAESRYGFYGFLNEDESVMRIYSWSKEAMKDCGVHNKPIDFLIEKSGVWGNAIRERKTLIINSMEKDHPFKRGLPEGHVGINRIMVVPVFRDNRIIALGAVANKADDYTAMDADVISKFMQSAQLIQDKKIAEEELRRHRENLEEQVEERTKELKDAYTKLQEEVTAKLNYQAEALRSAELASIGELAAGVAHEINNPINGIINLAHILVSKVSPGSKEHEMAGMIAKESDRIAHIVNNLLSFARESKQKKSSVQVYEIMADTLALAEAQLRKEKIKLKVHVPSSLPAIYAQPQQIEQVFLNIIGNARYAMKEKYDGAHENKVMSITGESVTADGKPFVRITFYDRGVGIPYDNLNKIMNPFFTTKRANEGTGLGLSICYGIIIDHGGRITVDSVEGEFTKVIIELPAD
jgi:PAS domain S-box-containing protein